MTYTEFATQVKKLYEAKLRTGAYDDYTPEMLDMLFEDCLHQVACMSAINERSITNNE
jgi:hypothetical protein